MGIETTLSQPVLHCEQLTKSFSVNQTDKDIVKVLNGVDISVNQGEFIAIIGASGTGKSTLLHLLGGLDRPNSGKVFWGASDIFSLKSEQLALLRGKKVGFVFQFHHLLNEFTAIENVMLPMLIQGERTANAKARALALLNRFSLANRKDHKPNELSGGEQQRIAIARALSNNPDILLADEPTGNLDTSNSQQLYDLLFELNKNDDLTTIIVTHNKELADKCDKTYQLSGGLLKLL